MAKKTWTLTDVDADLYVDQISIGPRQVGGPAHGYTVAKRRLHGGLREGVDIVEVDNGKLRFTVIPTRGMNLWRASCGNVQLGWRSPVKGPVNPAFVPVWEASGIGWLSGYDELFVRCGLESNGAPEFWPNGTLRYPLHGKLANTPAHKVEVSIDGESGEICIAGVVDEARLFGSKLRLTTTIKTMAGSNELRISDEITNLSAEPGEFELLYHINFGVPLVMPGAKLTFPVQRMSPRNAMAVENLPQWDVYGPEKPGLDEVCFFCEPACDAEGRTLAVLRSADGQQGVSVKFNRKQLPFFTLWKNRHAAVDGYVTGLEPCINFPNVRSFEKSKGRVATLAPGESRRFEVALEAHSDVESVTAAEKVASSIQARVKPEILTQPDPDWAS